VSTGRRFATRALHRSPEATARPGLREVRNTGPSRRPASSRGSSIAVPVPVPVDPVGHVALGDDAATWAPETPGPWSASLLPQEMRTGQGCRRRPTFEASAASRCLAWAGCRRESGISCGHTGGGSGVAGLLAGHAERGVDGADGPVQLAADRGGRRGQVAVVIGGRAGPLRPVRAGSDTSGFRLVARRQVGEHGGCQGLSGDGLKPGQRPLRRVSVWRMRQPGARA